MIELLIMLAIFVIVAVTAWWILGQLSLPPPISTAITIVFVVIGVIIVIYFLLHLVDVMPPLTKLR